MEALADDEALVRDFVESELLAMLAATQFHDRHDPFQLAVKFDIALQNDAVGQKGRAMGAEPQIDVGVHHFHRQTAA